MCKRGRCADGKAGDHGKDRRKCDRRDEGEEDISGKALRQQRSTHVGAAVSRDEIPAYDGGSAKAEERSHDVEAADQYHRPNHRVPRGLRVGHGVEADEDVRQSGGSEDQG